MNMLFLIALVISWGFKLSICCTWVWGWCGYLCLVGFAVGADFACFSDLLDVCDCRGVGVICIDVACSGLELGRYVVCDLRFWAVVLISV